MLLYRGIANKTGKVRSKVDYITILIYICLVVFGWVNIYAAVYNDDQASIFDLSQRYGMQMLWIGISGVVAITIMLLEDKYYHMFSYPLYWFMVGIMTLVLFFGKEVNGAKAWIDIAGIRIQPVEFMKIVTALALARYVSSYNFDLRSWKFLTGLMVIILLPVALILMQNDTGSAMVFAAFVIVLYREGFAKILYVLGLLMALIFVVSFLLNEATIIILAMLMTLLFAAIENKSWRDVLRYMAFVVMVSILISVGVNLLVSDLPYYVCLLISILLSVPMIFLYASKNKMNGIWKYFVIFVGAITFSGAVDYVFDNVLQRHQQQRILDLLDIEKDPYGWSYNVIQSKVAIGSGGLTGKGFLNGTQTKFSFVPEQSTDFIFCTVGEEWGFVGSLLVVFLFTVLIVRLIKMGERQQEPFARVYCYSVAMILFMHFAINITMTIGLFPVVGIPLPFFSYGGSSLLAFTVLLFIALRLDSSTESQF